MGNEWESQAREIEDMGMTRALIVKSIVRRVASATVREMRDLMTASHIRQLGIPATASPLSGFVGVRRPRGGHKGVVAGPRLGVHGENSMRVNGSWHPWLKAARSSSLKVPYGDWRTRGSSQRYVQILEKLRGALMASRSSCRAWPWPHGGQRTSEDGGPTYSTWLP